MKVYTNPNGTHEIHINNTESEPTGTIDGYLDIAQGDYYVNDDTKTVKMFNGSTWVDWTEQERGTLWIY